MKRANPLVVEVEEGQVVQLLQHHVARVVENVGARMVVDCVKEALEGSAIMQVFAGMQLEADVHAGFVEGVRMGRQRRASSLKVSSTRPAGRCGQG